MELIYLLFVIAYALLLLSMKRHWQGAKVLFPEVKEENNMAILIPFRNESKHLPNLLLNLEITIPPSVGVIFINDDSEDGSSGIIASFIRNEKHGNWVLLENSGIGKKAALATGINYTQNDIILTTDADCILPPNWTSFMGQAFQQDGLQLVAGPVMTVAQAGFFARFQQIEWASLLLMTQYLFSKGQPLMCSGANLAYRKSAFIAVEGYKGNDIHPSGDDEFLLKKVIQKYGIDSVTYLKGEQVLVKTHPAPDFGAFLQQRIRWAGKWRLHRSIGHAFSALFAFVWALIQIGTLILLLGSAWSKLTFFVFWIVKIGVERNVLGQVLASYRIEQHFFHFIKTSFLHPVYVCLVGFLAVAGKYTWKGRNNPYKF